MKEAELRAIAKCALCGKPFGHTGMPLFWRVRVQRFGVDAQAVQRATGLAMLLGSPALAMAMGPDEDIATPICEPTELTVCEACALDKRLPVAMLAESGQ